MILTHFQPESAGKFRALQTDRPSDQRKDTASNLKCFHANHCILDDVDQNRPERFGPTDRQKDTDSWTNLNKNTGDREAEE